jgi:hypothetical protein
LCPRALAARSELPLCEDEARAPPPARLPEEEVPAACFVLGVLAGSADAARVRSPAEVCAVREGVVARAVPEPPPPGREALACDAV